MGILIAVIIRSPMDGRLENVFLRPHLLDLTLSLTSCLVYNSVEYQQCCVPVRTKMAFLPLL